MNSLPYNLLLSLIIIFSLNFYIYPQIFAATPTPVPKCTFPGDTPPCNNTVNVLDFTYLSSNFGSNNIGADFNSDNTVNVFDFTILSNNFGKTSPTTAPPTATSTPIPATPTQSAPTPTQSPTSTTEWTQFAHDAQRTSFTPQTVATPWKYKWQWNGAGPDGKKQSGHLSAPPLVQPITGGSRVYTIANNTIFALSKNNGQVLWSNNSLGNLISTPIYENEYIYIASTNNYLYKLNASNGSIIKSYNSNSSIQLTPLLVDNSIYIASQNGILTKVDKNLMTKVWEYQGTSPSATPASFSPSRNTIIYVTQDLYTHAIDNTNGNRKWRVKPTLRNYQAGNLNSSSAQAEDGWPVIAEQHGLVFIRYRLDWDSLWTWNPYPTTNSQIRSALASTPSAQALFPLNLDNGNQAFIPAVGNGGAGDGGTLPMGPQPIIKTINDKEVAYIIWRNGLACGTGWCDGREDATMGEMVLDNNTVPGYTTGDMRFISYTDIQTDEMMNIAMSGDIIFHSHWLINSAKRITDRSSNLGATFTNPIKTSDAPFVIWRQVYCPTNNTQCNPQIFPGGTGTSYGPSNCPFNATTRYCQAGLYSYGDQRSYPPGFYEYHNDNNSGTDPFTVVSDGLVLIKTNDGAIMALENGNPLASNHNQDLAQSTTQTQVLGDTDTNNIPVITYQQADKYIGHNVTVQGKLTSAVNHRPKAIYLGFTNPHDGALLIRVFEKDLSKFNYDPMTLINKTIRISGYVTPYWPEGKDPEIIVSDPSQIEIIN